MGVQAAEAGLSQGGQTQILSPGNSVWTPGSWGCPHPSATITHNSFLEGQEGGGVLLVRNQGWREQRAHSWSWGDGRGKQSWTPLRILSGSKSNT